MVASLVRDFLAVLKICEVAVRVEVRETLDNDLQLVMYVGLIASTTLVLFGATGEPGAYQYGVAALNGGELSVRGTVETIAVSLWVFGVLVFVFESATDQDSVDREFLLVNASEVTFALGRSLARFIKYGDWIIAFSIIAGGLFALGARSALAFVTVTGGGLLAYFGAALLGSLAGSLVRYADVRIDSENALKYAGVMGALVAYFVLFLNREQLYADVLNSRISWYADLILLGVPGTTSDIGAATIAATSTVIALPLLAYTEYRVMLAIRSATDQRGSSTEGAEPLTIERSTSPVPSKYYRALKTYGALALRRPRSAVFVMVGPAVGYYLATDVLQSYPSGFEIAAVCGFALATGAGPTLNLLGNEGTSLTHHLTTPGGERAVVRTYVDSTLVLAMPLFAALLGALIYRGSNVSVWWITGAVALTAAAPFVSVTAGLLFSGYSKAKDGERTNHIPHVLALLCFVGAMSAVAIPFLLGALREDTFASYLPVGFASGAGATGAIITVGLSALLAGVCYWYTVNNLQERYDRIVL